ncbi:uncharacterized protein METZ01_LOCUS432728, partial [marine metagenome]
MQKNYISLTVGAILVIIFGFMLFTFQVRQTEVAIKTQFGKVIVKENKAGIKPGFHFRWPWPINKVQKFDNRLQSSESAFAQKSTRQGETILIKTFVNWKIDEDNPLEFFKSSGGASTKAKTDLQ